MAAYLPASQQRAIAQINITPLVDVMLVLLVIFMIAAPIAAAPMAVGLPQAGPDRAEPPPPRLTLTVSAAGEFFLGGTPYSEAELPAALRDVSNSAPRTVLEIDTSAEGDYQSFTTALAAAKSSGLQNIALPR